LVAPRLVARPSELEGHGVATVEASPGGGVGGVARRGRGGEDLLGLDDDDAGARGRALDAERGRGGGRRVYGGRVGGGGRGRSGGGRGLGRRGGRRRGDGRGGPRRRGLAGERRRRGGRGDGWRRGDGGARRRRCHLGDGRAARDEAEGRGDGDGFVELQRRPP